MVKPLTDIFDVPLKLVVKHYNNICNLDACKYHDPPITWGQLSEEDDYHFFFLLLEHLSVDDNAFHALTMLLKPEDRSNLRYIKWERTTDHTTSDYEKNVAREFIRDVYRVQLRST